ncbi:hypothetical protein EC991_003480 [Linnemannia zychae]|nr:hypothetical protein EC991_003480 [Linnemannia zychae]
MPVGSPSTSTSGATVTTTTAPGNNTPSSSTLIGAIAASARNAAATLDPRQADVLRQHHSFGSTGSSRGAGDIGSSSSKANTSSASRTFQHTTNALETLHSSSSSSSGARSGAGYSSGFRQTAPTSSTVSTGGEGSMDWDSFLGSSESNIQENAPYKPPSMTAFGFSTLHDPEPASATRHTAFFSPQQQQQQRHQFDEAPQQQQSVYQAHVSQPMNLTPANHAAFLEYLKSTAHPTQDPTTSTSSAPPTTVPPQFQHQSYHPPSQQHYHSISSTARPLFSNDIQHQQHLDGNDVLAFLDSTSYSEFVDEVEAAGIEKHQLERREFVYSEASLGPVGSRQTRSIFSTLQLIQHLPSERQDIVQYLLQQGTYADDVWSRPFGHDEQREEAASLAATQAEQDEFLQQQHQKYSGGSQESVDATTEEMERVLKQIVENATEEVKTGQTDGRALNRLLMVRSHITMGTKL